MSKVGPTAQIINVYGWWGLCTHYNEFITYWTPPAASNPKFIFGVVVSRNRMITSDPFVATENYPMILWMRGKRNKSFCYQLMWSCSSCSLILCFLLAFFVLMSMNFVKSILSTLSPVWFYLVDVRDYGVGNKSINWMIMYVMKYEFLLYLNFMFIINAFKTSLFERRKH